MTRLSPQQRADRRQTGTDLQRQIMELAGMLGWASVHFRPAQTGRGWRTSVEGPLGKGWPDLFLANPMRRKILAIECKRELGDDLTVDQEYVHLVLRESGVPVFVFRPSDMTEGRIQKELQA
jgi:hypothetical protein